MSQTTESMIHFEDRGDGERGFFYIRSSGDDGLVSLCLSLEKNGDYEVLLDRVTVAQLVEGLQAASRSG